MTIAASLLPTWIALLLGLLALATTAFAIRYVSVWAVNLDRNRRSWSIKNANLNGD